MSEWESLDRQECPNAVGEDGSRRAFLMVGVAGALVAGGVTPVMAQQLPRSGTLPRGPDSLRTHDLLDRLEIAELIQRERSARDEGLWSVMAASYHPDAQIDVSWFKGGAAAFVEASKKVVGGDHVSLHHLSPSVVTVRGDRALADTDCQLVAFLQLEGVAVSVVNHARLLWRVQKTDNQWLIVGLSVTYIRDILIPCNPGRVPHIDEVELASYRRSYQYFSYIFARSNHPARNNLPGIDRPDLMAALRDSAAQWLQQIH